MSGKRILLADADAQTLQDFREVLGDQWEIIVATSGKAALAELKKEPCDVVVADLDLPGVDGSELLNQIRKKYPKSLRFLLARDVDKERVMKSVRGAHQFITKPCDRAALKSTFEKATALEGWIPNDKMRELIARMRTLPTIPTLYLEVLAVLKAPDTTTEQVAAIISKDMAMTTKLLQVLNSAYFGLSRRITDPAEAVGILGFETVKSMVMAIKLLSQYDKFKPKQFSIDRLWAHSTEVAQTARQLTLMHVGDHTLAEAAFTAGLMHDVGKVVLAANFEDQYLGVQLVASKQQIPAWEVERDIFGASHAEVGAYLLGLWGMPIEILESAALHHEPSRSTSEGFTALTAVHVANVLTCEGAGAEPGMVAPKIDEEYLARIGYLDCLEGWREAITSKDFTKPVAKSKPVEVEAPAPELGIQLAELPEIAAPEERMREPEMVATALPAIARPPSHQNRWLYASVGAACLLLLFAAFALEYWEGKVATPRAGSSSAAIAAKQASDQSIGSNGTSTLVNMLPPTLVVRARSSNTESVAGAATKPAIQPLTFADLKLQGIFFAFNHSSAIINGKTVFPGDLIGSFRVVEITPSTVTVETHEGRKTLTLKQK